MIIVQEKGWNQNVGYDHMGRVQDFSTQDFERVPSFCGYYLG